jgi:hypothetical protein
LDFLINILFKPFFLFTSYLKARETFAFIFVVLVNLVTRLIVIDVADLSLNETIAIDEANGNIFGASVNEVGYSVFEPVYKLIYFLWFKLVNFSVYGMRSLSALLFSLGAGLLFKYIKKFVSFRVAAWVSLFYFINSVFIFHSQDINNSALSVLLIIISSFRFIELYYKPDAKNAIKLGIINCVLFYVSNAFLWLALIQVILFVTLQKSKLKVILLNLLVVLIGCNYFAIQYLSKNNILLNQFNVGISFNNATRLLHLNFTDYFFFNLMFFFILTMVLNIFVKKLNDKSTVNTRLIYRYFFLVCALTFIFICKSKTYLEYGIEINTLLFFSLSLSVLLGLICGHQVFSSKINLLVYAFTLGVFLPSIQLGVNKNWPGKAIAKFINQHQQPGTAILCDNYLPFLFYLSPADFKERTFKNSNFSYKNLQTVETGGSYTMPSVLYSKYDTLYFISGRKYPDSATVSILTKAGFSGERLCDCYGKYKLSVFKKN